MNDAYEEHLFDASDVCRNCLRRIRVERVDPVRSGMGVEYESHMTRHDRHTEVDHGPAESVTDQQGTFCTHCGTESAFDRIWDDVDFADPVLPSAKSGSAISPRTPCGRSKRKASRSTATPSRRRHSRTGTTTARSMSTLGAATEHAIVVAAMGSGEQAVTL